ncbi:glycosyl transferase [Saitoella coloradoensis]
MSVSAAKQQSIPSIWQCAVASALLKALLFPAYRSTDFEVHRNWLALTHSLPVSQWYYEKTSEWTLDYPPFFAYFEYALAKVARYFDVNMLKVNNLNYASDATVAYQRLSAVFTELFLAYALHEFVQRSDVKSRRLSLISALSIFLSPAFLIIDHIHFQYNGFLFGIFVLSLTLARNPHTRLHSGILFAVLLCFKHIFLYIAPAYFVFLLRAYCLEEDFSGIRFGNCVKLGTALVAVFGAAFGPFALMGQMPQVLSRLFPFSRGLCHAYWAPNVWALYSFLDRIAIIVAPGLGLSVRTEALNSVTRGLVGDTAFAVLPDITPRATFIVTLLFQLIALAKLSLAPTWKVFVAVTTLCGYASFLFGWHVHEKAILLVIIPFR